VRQKAGVLAVIEELGKLEPLMAEAAVEEVTTCETMRFGINLNELLFRCFNYRTTLQETITES